MKSFIKRWYSLYTPKKHSNACAWNVQMFESPEITWSFYTKNKWEDLRNLLLFVQFKKLGGVSFSFSNVTKVTTVLKVALLPRCFSRFLTCINGTKSHKTS